MDYKAVQKLAGVYSKEMSAFFQTNGGVVAPQEALLAYKELATRMLQGACGAYQRLTKISTALHEERLKLIEEALKMYYK